MYIVHDDWNIWQAVIYVNKKRSSGKLVAPQLLTGIPACTGTARPAPPRHGLSKNAKALQLLHVACEKYT